MNLVTSNMIHLRPCIRMIVRNFLPGRPFVGLAHVIVTINWEGGL